MNRNILIGCAVCFFLSTGIVIALVTTSKDLKQRSGSFLREFPPHPALEAEVLDLGYNSYYIAGGTDHHIYLANYAAPLHLIVANKDLTDTVHVTLRVKDIERETFRAIRVQIDSPNFYLTDGTVPVIYRGKVSDWSAERYPYDHAYFQDIVPITNESFFIRSLGNPVRENVLGKLTSSTPHVMMKPGILQKQVDGIFCTDGMMHVDRSSGKLIYLYRYRNEYMVMDTSVNVLYKHNTIDTTAHAAIEVKTLTSSGKTTLSSPPRMVNNQSSVSGNLLFINSGLLARNEHTNAHASASVIDVYELSSGDYRFSFYIHDYKGKEKLRMFSVFNDRLYVLHNTHLQAWTLRPEYFTSANTGIAVP